jgi:hypothetical protein
MKVESYKHSPITAQAELLVEADALVSELQLDDLLRQLGDPVRVGSAAMGLMVRRDIDITVVCPKLDPPTLRAFSEIGALLMQKADIVESVRFRNDSGPWNKEPAKYPDGIYLGLTVRARNGQTWTLDIWAVDQPDRQPDLAHLRNLLPRITDEHRRAILEIKQVLADRPTGAERVPSALVYEAVVDHSVQTIEQFEDWRRALLSDARRS